MQYTEHICQHWSPIDMYILHTLFPTYSIQLKIEREYCYRAIKALRRKHPGD